jgi:hypothetical protein
MQDAKTIVGTMEFLVLGSVDACRVFFEMFCTILTKGYKRWGVLAQENRAINNPHCLIFNNSWGYKCGNIALEYLLV